MFNVTNGPRTISFIGNEGRLTIEADRNGLTVYESVEKKSVYFQEAKTAIKQMLRNQSKKLSYAERLKKVAQFFVGCDAVSFQSLAQKLRKMNAEQTADVEA